MALEISNINYLAIIVAAIASFVVGYVWYMLLGKKMMKGAKIEHKGMLTGSVGEYLLAAIMAVVLAVILNAAGIATADYGGAIMTAFWVWLGFIATVQFSKVVWGMEKFNDVLFKSLYYLISLAVMAIILVCGVIPAY